MVHLYSYTLSGCIIVYCLDIAYWEQATKKEEDRVGGDQGIRVPEEVIDGFPNFEVGVFMFLITAVPSARYRSSQDAVTTTYPLGQHTLTIAHMGMA